MNKENETTFFGSIRNKLIILLVCGGAAFGATMYFGEKIPEWMMEPLAKAKSAAFETGPVGEYIGQQLPIPENYQVPLLAAVAAMALLILIFAIRFTMERPKTVGGLMAVAAAGIGYVFYFGDVPEPSPPGPSGPMVQVSFKNDTSSKVTIKSGGEKIDSVAGSGGTVSVEVPQFARVFFEADPPLRDGLVIPEIKVGNREKSYTLRGHRSWGDQKKLNGKQVNYYRANKYSYDIRFIDPLDIDSATVTHGGKSYKGGLRRKIFKDLDDLTDSTYDYHESDVSGYYLENHFEAQRLNAGSWQTESKAYGSSASMKEGFSASISAEAEFKGAKASRSGSYEHMSSNGSTSDSVYIVTRTTQQLYRIEIEKSKILLTDEFKDAVKALPEQSGQAYQQFIDRWGTHFARSVTYGGIGLQMDEVSAGSYAGMSQSGFSLSYAASVPVKGGSVGGSGEFGYSKEAKYADYFKNSKRITRWKGGKAAGSSLEAYSVSSSDAQPIGINLDRSRLSTLLTPEVFKDGTTEEVLKSRRANLKSWETKMAGTSDNFRNAQPRTYYVHCNSWRRRPDPNDLGHTAGVFGRVQIKVVKGGTIIESKDLWNRGDVSGAYVNAPDNYVETLPKSALGGKTQLVVKLPAGARPSDYTVQIYADLTNNTGVDDKLVKKTMNAFRLSEVDDDGFAEKRKDVISPPAEDEWGNIIFDVRALKRPR